MNAYKWSIKTVGQNHLTVGDKALEKVFDTILWTMTVGRTEGEGINWFDDICSLSGFVTLAVPDPERFLPRERVSQDRLLSWLEDAIDTHAARAKEAFQRAHPHVTYFPRPDQRDVSGIKARLDEMLEHKLSPPTFSTMFETTIRG